MSPMHPTRHKILEATVALLGREGPDGFSASALAHEAGVSKATLFHHFETLADIPLAALELMFQESFRPPAPGQTLRRHLEQMGAEGLAIMDEQGPFVSAYLVLFMKGLFDPRVRDRLVRWTHEWYTVMGEGLASLLGPEAGNEEIEELSRLVLGLLDGLALHHMILQDPDAVERVWRRFVELLAARYPDAEA